MGLDYRAFPLEDGKAIDAALEGVVAVLNCAGPYIHTFKPMVASCLRLGRHYLDITGEMPVYEGIAARDAEARAKGAMLLPGVGFDVVPTDCLAVHLKQRLGPLFRQLADDQSLLVIAQSLWTHVKKLIIRSSDILCCKIKPDILFHFIDIIEDTIIRQTRIASAKL